MALTHSKRSAELPRTPRRLCRGLGAIGVRTQEALHGAQKRLEGMLFATYVLHDMPTRPERLKEFLKRLDAAAPCASAEEAMTLVHTTLNGVEDEMSGIAFNPDYPMDDGRMYPPKEDARREVDGRADLTRYRSRKHNIVISDDGALHIEAVGARICLLSKPAHNGRMIQL